MLCIKPILITKNLDKNKYPDGLQVPCGKCLSCRVHKRNEWTMRMLHELDSWKHASFVTLTYSDEYLPSNSSLRKSDLQKFVKRVRKSLPKDRKIKYFACGEYGDELGRPHYHLIMFGISKKDEQYLKQKWPFGKIHVGYAEPDSIRYVAQYIDKKLSGPEEEEQFTKKEKEPVFRLLSKGIGQEYVKKNIKMFLENKHITMFGKKMSFPRYYLDIIQFTEEERLELSTKIEKEQIFKLIGEKVEFMQYYKTKHPSDVIELVRRIKSKSNQHNKNIQAKLDLKKKSKF